MENIKYCPGCKTDRPTSDFPKNKTTKDGFYTYCRSCNAERFQKNKQKILLRQKAYYEANKIKILAREAIRRNNQDRSILLAKKREYHYKNIDSIKAKKKQYYLDHWDERQAAGKRQYEANKEKVSAYRKEYQKKHKESLNARSRQYSIDNREKVLAQKKQYQKEHPETMKASKHNRKARILASEGRFKTAEWMSLKAQYHDTCLCCGRKEPEVKLVPDHVVALARGGRNDIQNIQPLCEKCNLSKGTKMIDYRPTDNQPSQ